MQQRFFFIENVRIWIDYKDNTYKTRAKIWDSGMNLVIYYISKVRNIAKQCIWKTLFQERRITMAKHKIFLGSMIAILIIVLVGQSWSQVRRTNRRNNSFQRANRRQYQDQQQIRRESEQRRREYQKRTAERRERRKAEQEKQLKQVRKDTGKRSYTSIKQAIGATEEQWKVIEPKFIKVRTIMREARVLIAPMSYAAAGGAGSRGGAGGMTGGSGSAGGGAWGGGGGSRVTGGMMGGSGAAGGGAGGRGGAGGGTGGFGLGSAGGRGMAGGGRMSHKETYSEETSSWSRSGWKWLKPSASKGPGQLTKGEKTCEELLQLLEDKNASQEAIKKKVQAVRNVREEARKKLVQAQQELRKAVTDRQEATLVLMGYLD